MQRLPWISVFLIGLTMTDFPEGRSGVNIFLLRDRWLMALDEWLIAGRYIVEKRPNAFDKWCSTRTTSRDIDVHFSEMGDFYDVDFELVLLSQVNESLTRARRLQRIFFRGAAVSRRKKIPETGIQCRSTSLVIVNLI